MDTQNPYASPQFSGDYSTDWTLRKRCAFWFSMLAIAVLMINSIHIWREYQATSECRGRTSVEQIMKFMFDK